MPSGKHKNPHYALRIPAVTMDRLKYIAEYNGRSANKEIEQLILRYIAEFEKKNGAISLDGFEPRSRA
ncbi:MAG: Arc family DNA-binding protein [Clostridiales bacterium]|nr:Arc family DNA-binding protein [Clostridiales bacterium]